MQCAEPQTGSSSTPTLGANERDTRSNSAPPPAVVTLSTRHRAICGESPHQVPAIGSMPRREKGRNRHSRHSRGERDHDDAAALAGARTTHLAQHAEVRDNRGEHVRGDLHEHLGETKIGGTWAGIVRSTADSSGVGAMSLHSQANASRHCGKQSRHRGCRFLIFGNHGKSGMIARLY